MLTRVETPHFGSYSPNKLVLSEEQNQLHRTIYIYTQNTTNHNHEMGRIIPGIQKSSKTGETSSCCTHTVVEGGTYGFLGILMI